MADKKAKQKPITSPKGIAKHPYLLKPDTYEGQNKYKVDLILDPADEGVEKYLDHIEKKANAAYKKQIEALKEKGGKSAALAKKLEPYIPVDDEYDNAGEPTGRKIVRFKSDYKPVLYDAKGNVITDIEAVWGGSIIRVASTFSAPWDNASNKSAGCSLYVNAVKIIELQAGGDAPDASHYGFDDDEGDFDTSGDFSDDEDFEDEDFDEDEDDEEEF